MNGIHLDIVVKDDGTVEVKKLDRALKEAGDTADRQGRRAEKGLDRVADAARRVSRAVQAIASKLALIATAAAAAATAGFGFLVKQGLAFNAQLEATRVSLGVIYNDTRRAGRAMKELVDFAARTPFQLAEVAGAAKILESFGLGGRESLRMVGDAAAAAQRPLEEVAMVFGRIKSGAFGDAFMRLAEMGLATREMLEAEGLKFDRSGAYVGSVEQAMEGITRIMNRRFKGMMEELSNTWNGKISTMKDAFSIMAGELTKPLFDRLKPRIDQISNAFEKIGKSKEGRVFFTMIAEKADKIAEKLVEWLNNVPRIFQWIIALWMGFEGLWESIKAGVEWFKNVWSAAIDLVKVKMTGLGASMNAALSSGPMQELGVNLINNLLNVNSMQAQAEKNLNDALDAPGLVATAQAKLDEIREFLRGGMMFDAPDQGGGDGEGPGLDGQVDQHDRILNQIQTLYDNFRQYQRDLWAAYWQDLGNIAREGFVDVVTENILLSGEELQISLQNIWDGMKRAFIRMSVDMATSWIIAKAKMQLAEAGLRKKALADEAASAVASAKATSVATGSYAGTAAAKYHAAYAAIPFAGPGIAAGFIAAMNTQIAASKALNMAFRTGGLVPGGGSGMEDNRLAAVSGGEYVQPAAAVRQYGEAFMDAVRTGSYVPGGGSTLNLTIVGGGGISEAEVEELLVPLLERLNEGGRFRVNAA